MRLIISPLPEDKAKREVMNPYEFMGIKIPQGFVFDGLTIPRLFWRLLSHPYSIYLEAGLVHDYLLYQGVLSRKECDKVFLKALEKLWCPYWKRILMYGGVRLNSWWKGLLGEIKN